MISAPMTVPPRENRPPVSDVPPMTTARIASSSIHRPALLPSALETLELIISPAMPAQSAQNTYDHDHDAPRTGCRPGGWPRRCRRPTRSACPSAVRRVSSAVSATTTATTMRSRTAASASSRRRSACTASLLTVMIWPSVISWARPRPATIRISVAMIGWMPMPGDQEAVPQRRAPAPAPSASADARAARRRALFWSACSLMYEAGERAGDGHHRADRQVDAAGGDDQGHAERDQDQRRAEQHDVDQAAVEVAVRAAAIEKKPGVKTTLTSSSATRTATGQNSRCRSALATGAVRHRFSSARDGLHDPVGVERRRSLASSATSRRSRSTRDACG